MKAEQNETILAKVLCPKCRCNVPLDYVRFIETFNALRCLGCLNNMTIRDLKSFSVAERKYLINEM